MELRAEEISQIIKQLTAAHYDKKIEVAETGTVLQVGDGIAALMASRTRWPVSLSVRQRRARLGAQPSI